MQFTVGTKLWLAFVVTITLCVLSLYLLLHNSLRQGFLDYTSQQSVQRLDILRTALVNIHQKEQSLQKLVTSPDRWLNLKDIIFSETHTLFSKNQGGQTNSSVTPQAYYRQFVSSISLHDTAKRLLLGVSKANQTLSWIPLLDNQQLVGYISFVKPSVVSRSQDQNFIQHQLKVFSIISILVLVIATLVATFFARRISLPLTYLAQNAQALASGDYSRKMPVTSQDEIAQLCRSFNSLSETLAANKLSQAHWVADISHEMRTPLSVLKMQVEAMQDGIRPLNRENLTLLQDKIHGLSKLIDDLFKLSLSDEGTLSYHKHRVNIATLIEICVEHYQVAAQAANLEIKTDIGGPLKAFVFGDADRLQQLLSNIIENSLRYTNPPGSILIKLTTSKTLISIEVNDSAPNIPSGKEGKIFERLYRVEHSRSRDTGGAGLGLAICKNIVSAHQGTIIAAPSELGGLKIRIDLPIIA